MSTTTRVGNTTITTTKMVAVKFIIALILVILSFTDMANALSPIANEDNSLVQAVYDVNGFRFEQDPSALSQSLSNKNSTALYENHPKSLLKPRCKFCCQCCPNMSGCGICCRFK